MDRRKFISTVGTGTMIAVAGCSVDDSDGGSEENDSIGNGTDASDNGTMEGSDEELPEDESNELVVATYAPFVDAPSTSPGAWLKEEFESQFDAEITYQTPSGELNHYIEQQNAGQEIEADVYVGLTTDQLVRADNNATEQLFERNVDVAGMENVKEGLKFDPEGRAIPFDTGYISLVYDSTQTEAPETFDGLLEEEHRGDLIAQDPASSETGRAFLLHTIHEYGEDGYLEYWENLQDNDVRVLGSWSDAYTSWSEGEAPMVVSYSTDQVFADMEGQDLAKHQIRFLNDQGYANPEGVGIFANTGNPNLARDFIEFLLEPDVQGEIAQRNVSFPATNNAELPAEYAELAQEPPEPVTFSYDELQGAVDGWVEDWERQFVSN
jgi:thiamine transport system substrate-binding protein